jgi:CheY-like chemotaxis protein
MSSSKQAPDAALRGQRVLIVEDELLVAMELQALLERQGCTVLGPVNTVARALALLDHERPDAALLDLNLNGQRSTPVAAALSAQQVPFLLVTGYGEAAKREPELRAAPLLEKPVDHRRLVRLLSEMV